MITMFFRGRHFIFLLLLLSIFVYPSSTEASWANNLIFHAPLNNPDNPLSVTVGNGQFTFRRFTTATYIHPVTNLVTIAGANTLPFSEDFSTSWIATNSQISTDQTTAPDGNNTADLFTVGPLAGGNVLHYIQLAATSTGSLIAGQMQTASIYVKQNSNTWISLALVGKNATANNCYFNTTTGEIGTCTAGVIFKSSTDVGSGWYRFSVSASLGSGGSAVSARIYLAEADNDWTWTGNNSNSVYIWGAQINSGPTLAPYSRTTGDYSALARIEAGGYLSENTRTNFITWSRDFTNAIWTKTNINTSQTATGHDGVPNSATIVIASANDGSVCQGVTIATATSSASVDIKRVSGSGTVSISMDGGLTYAGDVSSQLSESSWYRAVLENQKITNPSLCIKIGTIGDSIILDYAQIETGGASTAPSTAPFVSSRIPTGNGVQTRFLDKLSIPAAGNWNNAEGTFFAVADTWDTSRGNKFIVDGYSSAARVPMHIRSGEGNGSNGTLGRTTVYDGSSECSYSSVNVQPKTSTKMASKWSATSGLRGTSASGAVPANCAFDGSMDFQSLMVFGDAYNQDGTRSTFGHIKNARFYSTAFSNSEMQFATDGSNDDIGTSPSSPTSLSSLESSTSTVTLVWDIPSTDGGSAITDYLIQYSSLGATSTFSHAPNTATSTTVTGLTANTNYLFAISAINDVGTSSPATVSASTSAVVITIPSSPTSLNSSGVSTSTVSLTWNEPSSNGGSAITDYFIQYSFLGATSTFSHTPSAATSTTVTGLTANTNYLFAVSTINSVGTSSPATVSASTSAVVIETPPEEENTPATSTPTVVVPTTYSISSSGSRLPAYLLQSLLAQNKVDDINIGNTQKVAVVFAKTLKSGSSGEEVKRLQVFLNKNGFLINSRNGKAGSVGHETKIFGTLTKNALLRYQKKFKLYPADGTLNKATRTHINKRNK